jgi:hypothetical protein
VIFDFDWAGAHDVNRATVSSFVLQDLLTLFHFFPSSSSIAPLYFLSRTHQAENPFAFQFSANFDIGKAVPLPRQL